MRSLFFLMMIFACAFQSHAQYNSNRNKVWVFGDHTGINFNSGVPIPFSSSIVSAEGTASISDLDGNLLFYTNGMTIWNRAHNVMPSAASFLPLSTGSTSQAAVIVPMPGTPGKYYVFSLGAVSGTWGDALYYSVVDMSLDGGMGDIDTAIGGIFLEDTLGEQMVAVKGSKCDVWLLVHDWMSPKILAYNISVTGIVGPVISFSGSFSGYGAYKTGVLKASPDGTRLVSQLETVTPPPVPEGATELHDFDNVTGIASNCRVLGTGAHRYGAEFSPDNSKLYSSHLIAGATPIEIHQFDITLPTIAAILASETTVAISPFSRNDLMLAPDGKVYFPEQNMPNVHCISSPNVAGAGCGFVSSVVSLAPNYGVSGLPSPVVDPADSISFIHDTMTICYRGIPFDLIAPTGAGMRYYWNTGSTSSILPVSASGKYSVEASNGCTTIFKTFDVTVDTFLFSLGNDTTVAPGTTLVFSITPTAGTGVLWSSGSTGDSIHAHGAGNYWVAITLGACTFRDTIHVGYPVGINTAEAVVTSVFPNPAGGELFVNATGFAGESVFMVIYNAIGQQIMNTTGLLQAGALNANLNVKDLPDGIYQLTIQEPNGRKYRQQIVISTKK